MTSLELCNTQDSVLLSTLIDFYKNEDYINRLLSIVAGETSVSLRIIDWFVTNYAKQYYTLYDIIDDATGNIIKSRFKVHTQYKLNLNSFGKEWFDPFCRNARINIPYKDNRYIETTIGQLNFFKWAIKSKIVNYIEENHAAIEQDMNNRNSISRKRNQIVGASDGTSNSDGTSTSTNKTRRRRTELSVMAARSIKKENVEVTVKFE